MTVADPAPPLPVSDPAILEYVVRAEQLRLFGRTRPIRLPTELWRSWLTIPRIVGRFEHRRYRRRNDQCRPWLGAISSTMLCHRCGSHGCANPAHRRLGTAGSNRVEWAQRHRDPTSPLADVRGPAGRTKALAAAVLAGFAAGDTASVIDARYERAEAAGVPLTRW